jgi:hypothetical protein
MEIKAIMKRHAWTLGIAVASVALAQNPRPAKTGPAVGAVVPAFSATDQNGRIQTLQSVVGINGVMLVFFRSADW